MNKSYSDRADKLKRLRKLLKDKRILPDEKKKLQKKIEYLQKLLDVSRVFENALRDLSEPIQVSCPYHEGKIGGEDET